MKRRSFLGASVAVLALPRSALAQAAAPLAGYGKLLILVELKGGNDGLNTVVPYADAAYQGLRPRLALPRDQVLQLNQATGLHPALKPLMPLWDARELAIVQGVGYANPNLSHFRSIEIWDTASASEQYLGEGWLARCFAATPPPHTFAADGVAVGGNDMGPLAGTRARVLALNDPGQFQRQARLAMPSGAVPRNAALGHILKVESDIMAAAGHLAAGVQFRTEFPKNPFGNAVRTAAQLAANGAGVAAIRLSLGGFDTHQNQAGTHARLLGELAEGIAALKSALVEAGRWDSALVMTYAEFGRRPRENDTGGTDHGTAAPHFVVGGKVRGGLYGEAPRLAELEGGNLKYAIDFKRLYATALDRWWGIDSARALGGRHAPIELITA